MQNLNLKKELKIQVLLEVKKISKNMDLLILVKPQFEAERSDVKKGGLIFDHEIHARTVSKVGKSAIELGARVRGVIKSPITGAAGNREFFLWLTK